MNRNSIIAALALVASSGTAFAESYTEYNTPFVSSAPRATVDLAAARQGVNPWSTSYNPLAQFRSTKTRSQVTAEFFAERDRVAAFTAEDSGSAYLAARAPVSGPARLAGQPVNAR